MRIPYFKILLSLLVLLTIVMLESSESSAAHRTSVPSVPSDSLHINLLGQVNGVAGKTVIEGNRAYTLATGGGLTIVDISNPGAPFVLARYGVAERFTNLFVLGNRAYLLKESTLRILDVSNPFAITNLGTFDTGGVWISDLFISGNFAYLITTNGLQVVSVANSATPVSLGFLAKPDGNASPQDIFIYEQTAYIALSYDDLWIVNVANPSAPVEETVYPLSANLVQVQGNRAYVLGGYKLHVLDVTDSSHPVELGTFEIYDSGRDMQVVGNHVYLIDSRRGLQVVDVSTPTKPTRVAFFDSTLSEVAFAMTNSLIFVGAVDPFNGAEVSYTVQYTGETPAAYDCSLVTEISQQECEGLVAVYESLNGINWYENAGWLVTTTPCTWYGITCAAGHVIEIDLSGNHVGGGLPADIWKLSHLKKFTAHADSGDRQITGNLPPELGQLSQLEVLDLDDNALTGAIPPELGNATSLQILDISGQYDYDGHLSGTIPAALGKLVNLREFSADYNDLTGTIPTDFGNLTNLTLLEINSNDLSGALPAELGNLTNLSELYLYENEFSGPIPQSFTNLNNLSEFRYFSTNLCEPPDALFQNWLNGIEGLYGTDVPCTTSPVYSITGRVTDRYGNPLEGVTLTTDVADLRAAYAEDTTDIYGRYALTDLAAGFYTLTASHPNFTFVSDTHSVTTPPAQIGRDFHAVEVSGAVASIIYMPVVARQ